MSQITVLAGGWSASKVDLRKLPGTVIAVNDAAYYAPKWDICVSMDRIWAENRIEVLRRQMKPIWLRRSTIRNFPMRNLSDMRPIMLFECDHTSTTLAEAPAPGEPRHLNGTHSGFCALNLAYQMRPRQVFLVGFDMALGPKGERHWFPDYPWKNGGGSGARRLAEWASQFQTAADQFLAAQISVYVIGSKSPRWFCPIDRAALEREAECAA